MKELTPNEMAEILVNDFVSAIRREYAKELLKLISDEYNGIEMLVEKLKNDSANGK